MAWQFLFIAGAIFCTVHSSKKEKKTWLFAVAFLRLIVLIVVFFSGHFCEMYELNPTWKSRIIWVCGYETYTDCYKQNFYVC